MEETTQDTVELTVDDTVYYLRRHIGWFEADAITTAGMRMLLDGKIISAGIDLEDLENVEVEIDSSIRNLRRLCARLVGLKPYEIKKISRAHMVQIMARVEALEKVEEAELAVLNPKVNTEKLSPPSSATE